MKKLISSIMLVALVGTTVAIGAGAADVTGGIGATVTADVIAITVSDNTVAYGTMAPGETKTTIASGLNDTQIATNTGNVAETFTIKGSDSVAWTLETAADTDKYFHGWCEDLLADCNAAEDYTALDTEYKPVVAGHELTATTGHVHLDLWLKVPTINTATDHQHVDVTILATKH
jgi:hypothetical protein